MNFELERQYNNLHIKAAIQFGELIKIEVKHKNWQELLFLTPAQCEKFDMLISHKLSLADYADIFLFGTLVVTTYYGILAENAHNLPGYRRLIVHPITFQKEDMYSVITSLNDHYRWTREQIADWLDTLEKCPRFI